MKIIKLSPEETVQIYNQYMKNDFPVNELKPLTMIENAVKSGFYDCLGCEEHGNLTGYAFFSRNEGCYLLDYYAVLPLFRSQGTGSRFLELLKTYLKSAETVLVETEDPDFSADENDRVTRIRRLKFYLKNGYRDTGARAVLFGVNYILLEPDCENKHTVEQICQAYQSQYKKMLPENMYIKNVKVF